LRTRDDTPDDDRVMKNQLTLSTWGVGYSLEGHGYAEPMTGNDA
jgi:hypothetical protein